MAMPDRISSQRLARDSQMAMPEQAAQLKRIADYLYAIGVHMGAIDEQTPVEPEMPAEPAPVEPAPEAPAEPEPSGESNG